MNVVRRRMLGGMTAASAAMAAARGTVRAFDVSACERYVMRLTAYTAESSGKGPGNPAYRITASGQRAEKGRTVAAWFPIGTELYIPSFDEASPWNRHLPDDVRAYWEGCSGLFVVEDRGPPGIVDVYFGEELWNAATRQLALSFGRRIGDVYTVEQCLSGGGESFAAENQ